MDADDGNIKIYEAKTAEEGFGCAFSGGGWSTGKFFGTGNFVRHDVIDDSGLHFFRAIIYSVNGVITTMEWLFFDTPFVIIVMVSITIGIVIGKKQSVDKTYAWIMIAVNTVIPIVTYFPVCLGYSGIGSPNRCKFILTLVLVISVIIVSVLVGKIVACYLKADYMREIIGGGCNIIIDNDAN